MSASGSHAAAPSPPLYGSCNMGRSPFHWNHPSDMPLRLPWRTSVDEPRPSVDNSRRIGRQLSRAAQSLLPIENDLGEERQEVVMRRRGNFPRLEGFQTSPGVRTSEDDGGRRASHGSRSSRLSQALSPPTAANSDRHTSNGPPAADLQQPLLSDSGYDSAPSSSAVMGLHPEADVEAALPDGHYAHQSSQGRPSFDRSTVHDATLGSVASRGGLRSRYVIDGVTGVINTIVSLPVMFSFAVIIFSDNFFRPYQGSLIRLVLLSAAIHQAAFTALSTIPFAIGQVQDVGLIFCSSIATSVVAQCKARGLGDEQILATVLLTLALSTLAVGLAIVAVGKLRWASTVQYMPLSVIGGYLGYVGFFVAVSGASLATGRSFDTPSSILHLTSPEVVGKLAPAVIGAAGLWTATHRIRSEWALPATLMTMPAIFFAVLYGSGFDMKTARANSWFQPQVDTPPEHFWDVWNLYRISKTFSGAERGGVLWSAMPRQLLTVIALAFVVAFGSSLDVAAIQQDNSEELDYNRELITVGLSNIAAGISGAGYTGSYIFSQTIFSMRANVSTRACGAVVVLAELACFAAPFSIAENLPLFFFGALMLWIGYEIVQDWLIASYQRMTALEYLLLWLSFLAISVFGLEVGIAVGVLLAALFFSFQYARINVTAFSVVSSRSGFVRPFQERATLEYFTDRVIAVSLSGYIFFGSAVKIGENVGQMVRQRIPTEDGGKTIPPGYASMTHDDLNSPSSGCDSKGRLGDRQGWRKDMELQDVVSTAPRFCLLDFRRVSGIDGTATRQFCMLQRRLIRLGIELVITHVPRARPEVQQLLLANGIIAPPGQEPSPGMCRAFSTLNQGLHYCEEVLLDCAVKGGLCQAAVPTASLAEVLCTHLQHPIPLLPGSELDFEDLASDMEKFMTPLTLDHRQVLFPIGDLSDSLYIIRSGVIHCRMYPHQLHVSPMAPSSTSPRSDCSLSSNSDDDVSRESDDNVGSHRSLFQYGPGAIIGELDFFLQRQRSFCAHAHGPARLLVLPRTGFERMAREAPFLTTCLQAAVLRCTCLSAAHALEALETNSII